MIKGKALRGIGMIESGGYSYPNKSLSMPDLELLEEKGEPECI